MLAKINFDYILENIIYFFISENMQNKDILKGHTYILFFIKGGNSATEFVSDSVTRSSVIFQIGSVGELLQSGNVAFTSEQYSLPNLFVFFSSFPFYSRLFFHTGIQDYSAVPKSCCFAFILYYSTGRLVIIGL